MSLNNHHTFKYLILALFLLPGFCIAQSLKYSTSLLQNKDWSFVENKGQIVSTSIQYYGHQGGVYLYCKPGMIEFVFTKVEKEGREKVSEVTGQTLLSSANKQAPAISPFGGGRGRKMDKITTSRADLSLFNSNPNAQILTSDQQEYYENYYTKGNADSGITNVHTFKTITYKDIYPHINMVLACREKGLEYSFVVYPGGKVSDIQMQWEGIDKIEKLKDSKIEYSCALGKMEEGKPTSFQGDNVIASSFVRHDNKAGFKVGQYDSGNVLVIDPTLVWGTYYGGRPEYYPHVAVDISGNAFITGDVGNQSIIATSGAHQSYYIGGDDAFLAKFDSNGSLKWATYFGGGNDYSVAVAVDGLGNASIVGTTESTSHLATSGAYQTSLAGGYTDAFLAKFNGNGSLQWATYFGGNLWDEGWGVATDASCSIYITGWTESSSGIATNGAYLTYLSGSVYYNGDAFLAKFKANGSLQWATYYGETYGNFTNPTLGHGIAVDKFGSAYITGYTYSLNGIATSGAYKTSITGWPNAFLAKFDSSGSLKWGTYYGGTYYSVGGSDFGVGVALDSSDNAYITGYTNSKDGIATFGAYDSIFKGDSVNNDAFLAKFNGSGSLQWATYYGGNGDDESWGVAVDVSSNAYITGYTNSLNNIATTGAYQTSNAGGHDVFLAKFNSVGGLKWATYYGGSDDDNGYGIVNDGFGNVYVAGNTISDSGIATSGAYQTSLFTNTGYSLPYNQNAFLAKFSFKVNDDAGISSISNPFMKAVCSETDTVKVRLKNYGSNNLTKVNIQWSINHKTQPTYKWTGLLKPDSTVLVSLSTINYLVGSDTIKSWTNEPNGEIDSIPRNDTSLITVKVDSIPKGIQISDTSVCAESYITLSAKYSINTKYSWTSSPYHFLGETIRPLIHGNSTFYLYAFDTLSHCGTIDSVHIKALPLIYMVPNAVPNQTICRGQTVELNPAIPINTTFHWNSIPPGLNTDKMPGNVSPDTNTIYIEIVKNQYGCGYIDSTKIIVLPAPNALIRPDTAICIGDSIYLGEKEVPGDHYSWKASHDFFSDSTSDPQVRPKNTEIYIQTETGPNGCYKTDSVHIYVNPMPAVAMQNQSVCFGTSTFIGVTSEPGVDYQWSSQPPGFSSHSNGFDTIALKTITYILSATSNSGCNNKDSVTIYVNPKPVADAGQDTKTCPGSKVSIGSLKVSGDQYDWTSLPVGFNSSSANPIVMPNVTTTYILTVVNSNGCFDTASVNVMVMPSPGSRWKLLSYSQICVFKAIDSIEQYYQWSFGDGSIGSGYTVSHRYSLDKDSNVNVSLTVSSAFGCSTTFDSTIKINYIQPPNFYIHIFPNPFNQNINIKISLEKSSHIEIMAYDDIGRLIGKLIDTEQPGGIANYSFDTEKYNLAYGIYYLKILVDGKPYTMPVVRAE